MSLLNEVAADVDRVYHRLSSRLRVVSGNLFKESFCLPTSDRRRVQMCQVVSLLISFIEQVEMYIEVDSIYQTRFLFM